MPGSLLYSKMQAAPLPPRQGHSFILSQAMDHGHDLHKTQFPKTSQDSKDPQRPPPAPASCRDRGHSPRAYSRVSRAGSLHSTGVSPSWVTKQLCRVGQRPSQAPEGRSVAVWRCSWMDGGFPAHSSSTNEDPGADRRGFTALSGESGLRRGAGQHPQGSMPMKSPTAHQSHGLWWWELTPRRWGGGRVSP